MEVNKSGNKQANKYILKQNMSAINSLTFEKKEV